MWIAKIKMCGSNMFLAKLCKKHKVSVLGYPISTVSKNELIQVYFAMSMLGDEKRKDEFFSELKKSKRILGLERNGDFVMGNLKENNNVDSMYKYSLVHIDPIMVDKSGYEIWTVGSFSKEDLNIIIKKMEKSYNGELLKFVSKKISNISIKSIHPELTEIQRRAISLAIDKGYYLYPRKTDVIKLSKEMNLSYSTYHAHLRKAEMKLLPFYLQKKI